MEDLLVSCVRRVAYATKFGVLMRMTDGKIFDMSKNGACSVLPASTGPNVRRDALAPFSTVKGSGARVIPA
jgi:hypothetical protein